MNGRPSVLIIDDESAILETLRILLRNEGFDVSVAQGWRAGLEALEANSPHIVLTDIRMPTRAEGLDILRAARERDGDVQVILMTAHADLEVAIEALNQGASQYIRKPFPNEELVAKLRKAAAERQLRVDNRALRQEIRRRDRSRTTRPLGASGAFSEVLRLAEMVAPTDSTVLISGESGTGKEVLARYVHELSPRAESPFLSINCGALPESLLESELFGHVRGSFTGAVRDKDGLFVAARGGTFFLDEIGETTPATQVKLLRVLQEREVIPVGATEPVRVDVRLIAATNRDLEEELRSGRFRSDLFYRLNVIAIHLPPLRARKEDIPVLAQAFLARMAEGRGTAPRALGAEALEAIMGYDWPGNVRELENALERAATLSRGSEIAAAALPTRVTERRPEPLVSERPPASPTLDVVERAYIMFVLNSVGGNKSRAAEILGIDPSTLYRKLGRYEGDSS